MSRLEFGVHSADEIDQFFANNQQYLAKIEDNLFAEKVTQSGMVDFDSLTDESAGCYDYGLVMYTLLDFNELTDEYNNQLLFEAGDGIVVNTNQYAILLRDWLITLALEYEVVDQAYPCM